MINKMFVVFDCKAEAYLQPFFMQASGQAIRAWIDLVNDKTTQFSKHPEDYTLFELGTYDDSCAKFDVYATPKSLGVAIEFVKSE